MNLKYKRSSNSYCTNGLHCHYLFNNGDLPTGVTSRKNHEEFLFYLGIRFSVILRNDQSGIKIIV